ncbi:MAG: hypothetical protein QFF03_05100 [Pseudomonadota bacterium]|nr:hypothetical protein [Pseudomonadota bacterium]
MLDVACLLLHFSLGLLGQSFGLLAFAGVLDDKLSTIAIAHQLPEPLVRAACVLHRKPSTSPANWQGWNRLRARMGAQFHAAFDAVAQAMAQTPRSSALVENLHSRLRNYFTLRRQLGGSYLHLLQFFLNHRCFLRSRAPQRVGKSPTELMTGQDHPTGSRSSAWARFSHSELESWEAASLLVRLPDD